MNKDEFSGNAKAPRKKDETAKSSTSNASQLGPSVPGPRPPAPRPSFAGPMHAAVNIKPRLPVVKPVQESAIIKPEKTKDE